MNKKIFHIILFITLINNYLSGDINPRDLPQIQLGLGGVSYYTGPVFANALLHESRGWRDKATNSTLYNTSGQIDRNGYPLFLNAGQILIAQPGQNASLLNDVAYFGKVCLTWQGDADIRIVNCGNPIEGSTTGSILNGRRVYKANSIFGYIVEIHAINPANYPRKIRVWAPDPTDPQNKSLEPDTGQPEPFFHPVYLQRIAQGPFQLYRMMDMGATNANPMVDWADRRPENHCNQTGVINTRNVPGTTNSGPKTCGVSYETMAKLGNQLNRDIWVCVPHAATDDFVRKMAKLFAGKDPDNTGFPGLNAGRKLYLEYTNEVWQPCNATFPQGCYAESMATAAGLSKQQWIAKRNAEIYQIFEQEFANTNRGLVKVLAIWTSQLSYSKLYVEAAMSQAVKPDVMAVTTYFGNKIQDWVFDNIDCNNPQSGDLDRTFKEWESRILSDDASTTGVDFTGGGGGVPGVIVDLAKQHNLPVIAYEGGTGLSTTFTVYTKDCKIVPSSTPGATRYFEIGSAAAACFGGDVNSNPYFNFITQIKRDNRLGDIMYLHHTLAKAKQVRMISQFGDIGQLESKYGWWGMLENSYQPSSSKYKFWLEWYKETKNFREVGDSLNSAPRFFTKGLLPTAKDGVPYTCDINYGGGDGALAMKILGSSPLPKGLSFQYATNKITISGTPTELGTFRFIVRLLDTDKDPAYSVFTLAVSPSPTNSVFCYDDFGTAARNLLAANTGYGFSNNWSTQSSSTVFQLSSQNLTYPNLSASSGIGYNVTNGVSLSATRPLSIPAFNYLATPGGSTVGQKGTTLYVSFLLKRANTSTKGAMFFLVNGGVASVENDRVIKIGTNSTTGNWSLWVRDSVGATLTNVETTSTLPQGVNVSELVVLRIDFNEGQQVFKLYINPNITLAEPETATISYTSSGKFPIEFKTIGLAGLSGTSQISVDDIRFGDTYSAVTPLPDNIAPSTPVGFVASRLQPTSVNLIWNQSTDNVKVTGYNVYVNNTLFNSALIKDTFYTVLGLASNANYEIYVKAIDASNNLSGASSMVSITTPDLTRPTKPGTLIASDITSSSVRLIWNKSNDDVGVVGYKLFNYNTLIFTSNSTDTTVVATGLKPNTSYTLLNIKAYDSYGNLSDGTNQVSIKTLLDSESPAPPTGLSATNLSSVGFKLNWNPAVDNYQVASYDVYQGAVKLNTTALTTTNYVVTGLTPSTAYTFTVRAKDVAGNTSANSNPLNITTLVADVTAPTAPYGLEASLIYSRQFLLKWRKSNDNVAVEGYNVYRGTTKVNTATVTDTTLLVTGLSANTLYAMTVKAVDAPGNLSNASDALNVTTVASDVVPPTPPTGLSVSGITTTGCKITWTAGTDDVGVTAYDIYTNSTLVASTVTGTTYTLANLNHTTPYILYMKAKDAAGNVSDVSATVNFETVDGQAPTQPANIRFDELKVPSVTVYWDASSDNKAVAGYNLYVDDEKHNLFTIPHTFYTINNLVVNRNYYITVRALDAVPNLSEPGSPILISTSSGITTKESYQSTFTNIYYSEARKCVLFNINKDQKFNYFQIFDVMGKLIQTHNLSELSSPFEFSVADLKAGIYIIKLQCDTKTYSTKFIMKGY